MSALYKLRLKSIPSPFCCSVNLPAPSSSCPVQPVHNTLSHIACNQCGCGAVCAMATKPWQRQMCPLWHQRLQVCGWGHQPDPYQSTQPTATATSSLSLSLFLSSSPTLCLMLRYDLVRAERSRAYRFSLRRRLSHTIHPLFLRAAITPTLSTLSLPLYPLLFFLSPVCNHNNPSLRRPGNKPGSPFFLHISPSVRTKPIKGWLNYSC